MLNWIIRLLPKLLAVGNPKIAEQSNSRVAKRYLARRRQVAQIVLGYFGNKCDISPRRVEDRIPIIFLADAAAVYRQITLDRAGKIGGEQLVKTARGTNISGDDVAVRREMRARGILDYGSYLLYS